MDAKLQDMINVIDLLMENMQILSKCCEDLRAVVLRQKQIAESLLKDMKSDHQERTGRF